ncbi:hypothetical protein GEMRC1_001705 [Eukaryota sp. GEM-RC1]
MDFVKNKKFFSSADIKKILIQTTLGLKAFHDLNLIHGAISANCFYLELDNENGDVNCVKIGNAHYCDVIDSNRSGLQYRRQFKAPELSIKEVSFISKATDVYALGILFYFLLTGTLDTLIPPLPVNEEPIDASLLDDQFAGLVKSMTNLDALQRPSCDQVIIHLSSIFNCTFSSCTMFTKPHSEIVDLEQIVAEHDQQLMDKDRYCHQLLTQHINEIKGFQEADVLLRKKLSQVVDKCESLDRSFANSSAYARECDDRIAELESAIRRNLHQTKILDVACNRVHKSEAELKAKYVEKARVCEQNEIEKRLLTTQLSTANDQLAQAEHQYFNLTTAHDELITKADEIQNEVDQLQSQLIDVQRQNSELKKRHSDIVESNNGLQSDVLTLQSVKKTLEEELENSLSSNDELMAEIETVKKSHRAKYERFNAQLLSLISELEPVPFTNLDKPINTNVYLVEESADLHACKYCKRTFILNRLAKHESVCIRKSKKS